MSRAVRRDAADDRPADQREVADQVENLVPNAFVGIAKFVVDDRAVAAEDEQIGRSRSASDALAAEPVDFAFADEGPGRRDVAGEGVRRVPIGQVLLPNARVVAVVEFVSELVAAFGNGGRLYDRVVLTDADVLLNDERRSRRALP